MASDGTTSAVKILTMVAVCEARRIRPRGQILKMRTRRRREREEQRDYRHWSGDAGCGSGRGQRPDRASEAGASSAPLPPRHCDDARPERGAPEHAGVKQDQAEADRDATTQRV